MSVMLAYASGMHNVIVYHSFTWVCIYVQVCRYLYCVCQILLLLFFFQISQNFHIVCMRIANSSSICRFPYMLNTFNHYSIIVHISIMNYAHVLLYI